MPTLRLHVDTFGDSSGDTVLLLHGSGAPPASLRGYAESLADSFHVLLPHRNGYSDTGVHPWDPTAELDALADLIDDGTPVVGHSFGNFRAFQLAVRHPGKVSRVLAMGPIAGLPEAAREAVEGLVAFIRSGADLSEAAAQRWAAPAYLAEHPEFVDRCREWLAEVDDEILALENLEVLDGGALMNQLAKAKPDVRLYVGALDAATPPELAQALAGLVGTDSITIVDGMGHSPMVERPEQSTVWIRENLA